MKQRADLDADLLALISAAVKYIDETDSQMKKDEPRPASESKKG